MNAMNTKRWGNLSFEIISKSQKWNLEHNILISILIFGKSEMQDMPAYP